MNTHPSTAAVGAKVIVMNHLQQILVLKKSDQEQWDIPGGGILANEQPVEGAARELLEETGLVSQSFELRDAVSEINHKRGFSLYLIYLTKVNGKEVKLSPEHSHYQWVDIAKVLDLDMSDRYKNQIRVLVQRIAIISDNE